MLRLGAKSDAWLSLTPEPERELPKALAALAAALTDARGPTTADVERERQLLERLVVCGKRRAWMARLSAAIELAEAADPDGHDPDDRSPIPAHPDDTLTAARELVIDVLHNHHQLLLGVDPREAERSSQERALLEQRLANSNPKG